MENRKVETEIFQFEYQTAGSFPSQFDCSDNQRYIVKHHQQGSSYKQIINELIAVQLAKLTNIPVPDFALIVIKDKILPVDYKYAAGKPAGLGFGSLHLPGTIRNVNNVDTIGIMAKLGHNKIVEDFIKICAFDIWLRNTDRSINNPNLILQVYRNNFRLFGIDHSSIFSELNYLNLEKELDEPPPKGETLVDQELFLLLNEKYGLFFKKLKEEVSLEINNVTEFEIRNVLDNIPSVWKINNEEKEAIFRFINKRKNIVENHFDILLKEIGL